MTNLEMKQEFLILYDKVTNFEAPGYEDIEISTFLTKGQERVVLSYYTKDNKFRESFEESELRRKDLAELVTGATLNAAAANQSLALPNGTIYELPEDCLYVISEEVTLLSDDACINNSRLRIKPITHDEYSINLKNPFKKPKNTRYFWRLDLEDSQHEIITDGTSVAEYHLRYIKQPKPIIIGSGTLDGVTGPLDCELNPIIHRRIIDEAVKIATGVTNPEFYQIKTIEQQQGE